MVIYYQVLVAEPMMVISLLDALLEVALVIYYQVWVAEGSGDSLPDALSEVALVIYYQMLGLLKAMVIHCRTHCRKWLW